MGNDDSPAPPSPHRPRRHRPRFAGRPHLRVLHLNGRPVLVPRTTPPRSRRHRGALALPLVALLLLIPGAGALIANPALLGSPPSGPCPDRTSQAIATSHGTLRIRTEHTRAHSTTLIHLCADPALGPVTAWSATTHHHGIRRPVPVQAISDRLALSALTSALAPGTELTVTLRLPSGARSSFTTTLTA
ncbi:hypothetical protein AB0M02_29035 [Actinoplanes sp. NPDC051861]|uniref:hypothetical protein n=1 Tax=Actinoplanes sp. NPDC051861 TaxID=3155170 RepID=UPI00343074A9